MLTADCKYDIFGNRVEKDVTTTGTATTRYAYDMWNPAKAGAMGTSGSDIWAVLNGSSSLTSRELQGDGIDEHLAYTTSGSNAFWFLSDHLGSIRTVVDSTGAAVHAYSYDAFGNVTSVATPSMYAWTGREFDAETGLQYNRARYYDATTGRWISLDPMGFDAGDSNLYRYVNNASTASSDPSGLVSNGATLVGVQIERISAPREQTQKIKISASLPELSNNILPEYVNGGLEIDGERTNKFDGTGKLIDSHLKAIWSFHYTWAPAAINRSIQLGRLKLSLFAGFKIEANLRGDFNYDLREREDGSFGYSVDWQTGLTVTATAGIELNLKFRRQIWFVTAVEGSVSFPVLFHGLSVRFASPADKGTISLAKLIPGFERPNLKLTFRYKGLFGREIERSLQWPTALRARE